MGGGEGRGGEGRGGEGRGGEGRGGEGRGGEGRGGEREVMSAQPDWFSDYSLTNGGWQVSEYIREMSGEYHNPRIEYSCHQYL